MFRRKPPQLSLLDELQQTYNDVCNLTVKNLTHEEENNFEDALKGWKSLHTSLLYKTDIFEKQQSKLSNDELTILQELKNIRDENVKHLIRVQLRIDEKLRKQAKLDHKKNLPPTPSQPSSMSIPSLRTTNTPSTRSLTNSGNTNSNNGSRSMLRSLRPGGGASGSHNNGHSKHSNASKSPRVSVASKAAANLSWSRPSKSVPSTNLSNSSLHPTKSHEQEQDSIFDDFDQDSFEFNEPNWERTHSLESGDIVDPPDLIDLTSDSPPGLISTKEDDDYFGSISHSLEDLNIGGANHKKLQPPPPPPPRLRGHTSLQGSNNASSSSNALKIPTKPTHFSKSTSDIREHRPHQSASPPKKKYVYNKPKPININHLMKPHQHQGKSTSSRSQANKNQAAALSAASVTSPTGLASSNKKKVAPSSNTSNKNSNISYHYKIIPKAGAASTTTTGIKRPVKSVGVSSGTRLEPKSNVVKRTSPSAKPVIAAAKSSSGQPYSPTMDDILNGYHKEDEDGAPDIYVVDEDDQLSDEELENEDDENEEFEEGKAPMSEEAQDALIKSIRGIDPLAAKQILNDIVVHGDQVYWDDIVGLEGAKSSLKEAVVYPFLRPDLFRGLREPTRGMLLFGPPGTGKTMLARAVATESKSTFFSISSSSLTSKYLGESEKLVKALFLLAKKLSPSIVFMDEIDSLLSSRTEGEVESSRRIKNEFLVQWSELSSAAAGRSTNGSNGNAIVEDVSRVLILGATNLPWSIDEAARRRFVKRVHIPLPEPETRKAQIMKLLSYQNHTLSDDDFDKLIDLTEGFSGSDITALAKDSAMGPLRSLGDKLLSTPTEKIRPIQLEDFIQSLNYIRPSVSSEGLEEYEKWAVKFGSSGV